MCTFLRQLGVNIVHMNVPWMRSGLPDGGYSHRFATVSGYLSNNSYHKYMIISDVVRIKGIGACAERLFTGLHATH